MRKPSKWHMKHATMVCALWISERLIAVACLAPCPCHLSHGSWLMVGDLMDSWLHGSLSMPYQQQIANVSALITSLSISNCLCTCAIDRPLQWRWTVTSCRTSSSSSIRPNLSSRTIEVELTSYLTDSCAKRPCSPRRLGCSARSYCVDWLIQDSIFSGVHLYCRNISSGGEMACFHAYWKAVKDSPCPLPR